jgi:23S rRNA pseudouridine1911/1915/1917 synthase
MEFTAVVPDHYTGHMLRSFILNHCHFSVSLWKRIKWNGEVLINGVPCCNARTLVHSGDKIVCHWSEESDIIPAKIPLSIVYEDQDLLVVDKGPGMIIHPTSKEKFDTLVNACAGYFAEKNESCGIHPVYRLDRNTTGLVVVAKSALFQYWLSLSHQVIHREYIAIAENLFFQKSGTIDEPIGRVDGSTVQWEVRPDGKRAVTHYEVLAEDPGQKLSLLKIWLETGRTHQIRVHMSHHGHPLAGDDFYGGHLDSIQRQALHAWSVSFIHPMSEKPLVFTAPVPDDMKRLFPYFDWKSL